MFKKTRYVRYLFVIITLCFPLKLNGFELLCKKSNTEDNTYYCGSGKKNIQSESEFYSPLLNPVYTTLYHFYPDNFVSHRGIDIVGSPEIYPAKWGTVVEVCSNNCHGSYGRYVMIDHGNSLYSLYGHMRQVFVELGEIVMRHDEGGTILGLMGATGLAEGVHLHFEMRCARNHSYAYRIDPVVYLPIWISQCSNMFGLYDAITLSNGSMTHLYGVETDGRIFVK